MTVEKDLTRLMLEEGRITIGARERETLRLGPRTIEVTLNVGGGQEPISAVWHGRDGHLIGDDLRDFLQLNGQVGWFCRVERIENGEDVRLSLKIVERRRSTLTPATPRPAGPRDAPRARRERRRVTSQRYRLRPEEDYEWIDGIGFLREAEQGFVTELDRGGWDTKDAFELRLEAERIAALDQFEELLAVDVAKVDRMPHQEAAAKTVLVRMRGRGILADEVGLGKTIEAGLILKELSLRGLARRVLVVCPATLRDQWHDELENKFEETFQLVERGADPMLGAGERIIVSLTLATMNREVLSREWDLVVVDEAHKLASAGARKRRALVEDLSKRCRYLLLLSATPVQNDLFELFRLVQILRPGTFTSARAFRHRYIDRHDRRRPVRAAELRELVSDVMVRTTRAQAGLNKVTRVPLDVAVQLSAPERELYERVTRVLRNLMTEPGDELRRRQLAHRLTASPHSLSVSALRLAETHPEPTVRAELRDIGHLAADIGSSAREDALMQLLPKWVREHGRVIVFTQHTDTVRAVLRRLDAEGIPATPFHGGLTRDGKARAITAFESGEVSVLVSTDSGAEGLNLQVSNCVINFDLPWNPMKIEQRIGRVDRLTQAKDKVHIANLYVKDTIDEDVYSIVRDKLAMFELLFGQVTTILGELGEQGDASFERRALRAALEPNDDERRRLLAELGRDVQEARASADEMIRSDEVISSWLETTHVAEASELMPEVVEERQRQRQHRVRRFVRRFLEAFECPIIVDDDDYIAFRVPDQLRDEFAGREEVHLAFDRQSLDRHLDAELCAAGSEAFDDFLEALRLRGDLFAEGPLTPAPPERVTFQSASHLQQVDRQVEVEPNYSATGYLRASTGQGDEHIVETCVGASSNDPPGDHELHPLTDGKVLPSIYPEPTEVLAATREGAHPKLHKLAEETRGRLAKQTEQARTKLEEHYARQLATQNNPFAAQELESARARFAESLGTPPEVKIRAELLALRLELSNDFVVVERWRHHDGRTLKLRYRWDPEVGTATSAAGGVVETLDFCAEGHAVDSTQLTTCERCREATCAACSDDQGLVVCAVCDRSVCSSCLGGQPVCDGCRSLEAATHEEIADLPSVLTAKGLSVHTNTESDLQIVTLQGCQRNEIAVLKGGDVVSWHAFSERDLPEYRLLLELKRAMELEEDIDLDFAFGAPLDAPELTLPLLGESETIAEWQLVTARGDLVDSGTAPCQPDRAAAVDVLARALIEGDGAVPGPRPADDPAASILQSPRIGPAARLVVEVNEIGHRSWLDAEGITTERFRGGSVDTKRTPFNTSVAADWVLEGWHPDPHWTAVAEIDGAAAALTATLRQTSLAVRLAGETQWHWVRRNQRDLQRAANAAYLGAPNGTLLKVTDMTDPSEVRVPQITDGHVIEQVVSPTVEEPQTEREVSPLEFTEKWGVEQATEPPHHGRVPPAIKDGLIDLVEGSHGPIEVVTAACGVEVETRWRVGEREVIVPAVADPGDPHAYARCETTGDLVDLLSLDDEGHLTRAAKSCAYCRATTCALCRNKTAGCSVCRMAVCNGCATRRGSLRLCHACTNLQLAGPLARWSIPKNARPSQPFWTNADPLHRVVAFHSDGWQVVVLARSGSETRRAAPNRQGTRLLAWLASRSDRKK